MIILNLTLCRVTFTRNFITSEKLLEEEILTTLNLGIESRKTDNRSLDLGGG